MADAPIFMDLGDFIPEMFDFGFTINGHKYRFQFPEATVDETLRLMWATSEGEDAIAKVRRVVADFLTSHVADAEKTQLSADLALVPFKSGRGQLDITTLLSVIQGSVKKKVIG